MHIYLTHSTGYDYKTELYAVIRQLSSENVTFYFPHDDENNGRNSRKIIENCDVVLAEVSFPSTGQGIELGWADSWNKEIVCIFKSNSKVSQAVHEVSSEFIEYKSAEDLARKLSDRFI